MSAYLDQCHLLLLICDKLDLTTKNQHKEFTINVVHCTLVKVISNAHLKKTFENVRIVVQATVTIMWHMSYKNYINFFRPLSIKRKGYTAGFLVEMEDK